MVTKASARPAAFSISSPADGSTYLIDPTLRREFQTLSLKTLSGAGPVEWQVNGRSIGKASAGGGVEWSLVPGRHVFVARDARGRTAEASITVR